MLTLPKKPVGRWIMNEEGLKIYDGLNILVEEEKDINKALKIGNILFDDFALNSEGFQTSLESDQLKEQMEKEWEIYNNHCTECEKKLPKRYYNFNNKNLCGRCYKKEDTLMNRITLQTT